MKKISFTHGFFAATLLLAVAFAPIAVHAQEDRGQDQDGRSRQVERETAGERRQLAQENAETRQQNREDIRANSQDRREVAAERLEAGKLRACQNREKAIQNIMSRIADRSTKQLTVFTTIAERTQAFYEQKGNELATYDALVAEVDAKKAGAELAVETIQAAETNFSCDGENPKAVVASFKESLRARNAALNDYKTAIKDLIVGVKSAQGERVDILEGGQS